MANLVNVNILVVEDSSTQAYELKQILEKKNYQVFLAENGQDALRVLGQNKIQLVISDVIMPSMDGFEFCTILKNDEKYQDIPVILLTTLKDPNDIIRGLESGADNFITKPYHAELLYSRIYHVLVNKKMRDKGLTEMGIELFFAGKKHFLTSDRLQIMDLLISSFESALQKSQDLEAVLYHLRTIEDERNYMAGFFRECPVCHEIHLQKEHLQKIDRFFKEHPEMKIKSQKCLNCINQE